MLEGKSGVDKTTIFDASTFPSTFSAEVKDYDFTKYVKYPRWHEYSNRGSAFVIGATVQACEQAGIDVETDTPTDRIDRNRLGIYLGAGEGSVGSVGRKHSANGLASLGRSGLRQDGPNARA
jgi:3-oxoacyl-[acyl-carrier-protein] synthase II